MRIADLAPSRVSNKMTVAQTALHKSPVDPQILPYGHKPTDATRGNTRVLFVCIEYRTEIELLVALQVEGVSQTCGAHRAQ